MTLTKVYRASIDHMHGKATLGLPKDFVLHSLRRTFLTRLGEAGVDDFTIMRIAGHSSVEGSQKYVHPSTDAMERDFERLETLNSGVEPERTVQPETTEKSSLRGTVARYTPKCSLRAGNVNP